MGCTQANSLSHMAIVLEKLKCRSEALQHYQQAQQIDAELQLDFRVEQCQEVIAQLQKRFSFGEALPTRLPRWG
jgi:hypothetical protein